MGKSHYFYWYTSTAENFFKRIKLEKSGIKQKKWPTEKFDWAGFYVLTQHWKSNLEFYKQDLLFLRNLIDDYFIWISQKENVEMVNAIGQEVLKTLSECKDLIKKIAAHAKQLASMVQGGSAKEVRLFIMEHEHLENEMAAFVKNFRKNRKQTFKITEYVIDIEKISQLLTT